MTTETDTATVPDHVLATTVTADAAPAARSAASPLIRLHANDDVLIARAPIALGQVLPELGLRMRARLGKPAACAGLLPGIQMRQAHHRA